MNISPVRDDLGKVTYFIKFQPDETSSTDIVVAMSQYDAAITAVTVTPVGSTGSIIPSHGKYAWRPQDRAPKRLFVGMVVFIMGMGMGMGMAVFGHIKHDQGALFH